jgi:hypothetical protein
MPIGTTSYGLYTDEDCTISFSGTLAFTHQSNLSDNPQDTVLYLGSVTPDRVLQNADNPGVDDIEISLADNTPAWQASTAYVIGDIVQPTVGNTFIYKCVDAGTSAGSQPTWPVSGYGSTVADGGVIWSLYAKHHPTTEIKLATTSIGLDTAVAGASLSLGTSIDSGAENAAQIHIRVTNTVTTLSNNVGHPEISFAINSVTETG